MLTVKLGNYSREEVDLLIEAIDSAVAEFSLNLNTDFCRKRSCDFCKVKHVCYDLSKLQDFLTLEAKYNYPHSKK